LPKRAARHRHDGTSGERREPSTAELCIRPADAVCGIARRSTGPSPREGSIPIVREKNMAESGRKEIRSKSLERWLELARPAS
jgi:hypothetical protein